MEHPIQIATYYNYQAKDGALVRKDGDTEIRVAAISGRLVYIGIRKAILPKVELEFLDIRLLGSDNVYYCLSLNVEYSPASNIFNVVPCINPNTPLMIKAFKDKEYTALCVFQEGKALKYAYTKDDPKGKPDWISTRKGWDRTDEITFFINSLEPLAAKITEINKATQEPSAKSAISDLPIDELFNDVPPGW